MAILAGFVSFTASAIQDVSGSLLASGTVEVLPTDTSNKPITAAAGGSGGQMLANQPAIFSVGAAATPPVAAGAVQAGAMIADTTQTKPTNICYRITIKNAAGLPVSVLTLVQTTANTPFNLDTYAPNVGPQAVIQQGPPGPAGAPGGLLATTPALADTSLGSVGTSVASARADHTHPIPLSFPGAIALTDSSSNPTAKLVSRSATSELSDPTLAHYICDTAGQMVLGIHLNGSISLYGPVIMGQQLTVTGNAAFNGSLIANGPFSQQAVQIAGMQILTVTNDLQYNFALADSTGQVALGIKADGTTYVRLALDPIQSVIMDLNGNLYFTKFDVSGKYQIWTWTKATQLEAQLTSNAPLSFANNFSPQITPDGNVILFLSDRTGSIQKWRMNLSGANQVLAEIDLANAAGINVIMGTGQSNMAGFVGTTAPETFPSGAAITPVLTTTEPFNNLMLNGGVRCGQALGQAIASNTYTSLVPLVEQQDSTQTGNTASSYIFAESVATSMATAVTTALMKKGYKHTVAFGINAWSGHAISDLQPGGQTFTNGLTMLGAFKSLATAAGKTMALRAIVMDEGEADEGGSNASYATNVLSYYSNATAQYAAVTGQTLPIWLIMSQLGNSQVNNHLTTGIIPYLQLQAAAALPDQIFISGPGYLYPRLVDGQHLTPDATRLKAEYHAKVYSALVRGQRWRPVQPKTITILGKVIIVNFEVPVAPLVFDTSGAVVTEPSFVTGSLHGFEFTDGTSSPPSIISATVMEDGVSVKFVLSAVPTVGAQWYLSAAYTATANAAGGPTTGPRTTLRDSDQTQSVNGYGTLSNWCVSFHQAIS